MLLSTVKHLAEGLDLSTLLTLKMGKSLIHLEGTRRLYVYNRLAINFVVKTLMRNKA
jgi:hypothetical protein